jgi:hypothetical protein
MDPFQHMLIPQRMSFYICFWWSNLAIYSDDTVSCTAVLKKYANDSAIVISQTFYDLRIPRNLVGNRSSAKSIMVGTLFLYLQDALASGGFSADPTLARIIRQDLEIVGAISIATTRVPDFGEQISNPSHGF